jgi:hypothetical protein
MLGQRPDYPARRHALRRRYVAMANGRNAGLPLEIRGMWPVDFDILRAELPQWLERAEPERIARVGARLVEITRYFGQSLPSDIIPLGPSVGPGSGTS